MNVLAKQWVSPRGSKARPLSLLTAFAATVLAAGCGGGQAGPVPEPSYAESRGAQDAFHAIEARWIDANPSERLKLDPSLRAFLSKYGHDDRARTVRCLLGWLEIERRRPEAAQALAAPVLDGPPGAARDFATLVRAAAIRRQGGLEEALRLLAPLRGKIVDPEQRGLFSEELVRALIDARRFKDAISAMLDWAEEASPSEREGVVAAVEALVRDMPAEALEAGLSRLYQEAPGASSPSSTRAEALSWLTAAIRERLVRIALTNRDAELARRLIDSTPPRLGRDEVREVLAELAATSSAAARVEGRAVGFVLDVTDAASKQRSAEVVAGMTRALGLPKTAEQPGSVRVLTRDCANPADMDHALAGLTGDGAAILVAGVTDETAVSASLFAERTRTPVIVLRKPTIAGKRGPFTFVLGADIPAEESAISAALERERSRVPVRVGPSGIPCDAPDTGVQGSRFPVADWKRDHVDALVLIGSADCAREAALAAMSARLTPLIVLGLEASEANESLPGTKLLVSAGRFPFAAHKLDKDEQAWVDQWGIAPSWYATLGRDAAVLSTRVLSALPTEAVQEERAVNELHRRARDGLTRARATLWSTAAPGFEGSQVIAREMLLVRSSWGSRP